MSNVLPNPVIQKLSKKHVVKNFDCGTSELNNFLQQHALQSQQSNNATTYIACSTEQKALGYYSLAVGSVIYTATPTRIAKGLPKHPIPVMLLARLAVDKTVQKHGIGKGLLKDALIRTAKAADIAGIRALLVHAKNENAKNWYQQFDFEASPTDPFHLYLLLKDLKKYSNI